MELGGPYGVLGIEVKSAVCKASALTHCTLSPASAGLYSCFHILVNFDSTGWFGSHAAVFRDPGFGQITCGDDSWLGTSCDVEIKPGSAVYKHF